MPIVIDFYSILFIIASNDNGYRAHEKASNEIENEKDKGNRNTWH